MSLFVQDIMDLNLLDGAHMAAGGRGALSAVRWVNIMEILDAPDSVQAHELLVTTGYQMEDEERHRNLIASLKARGACGIAIQPGYYIPAIPPYILAEANRLDFPVIELPKELTFSHITHVLLDLIRSREAAAFSPDPSSLQRALAVWDKAAGEGGPGQEQLRCLIWLAPSGDADSGKLRQALGKIGQALRQWSGRVLSHTEGPGTLLFLQGIKPEAASPMLTGIHTLLCETGRNEDVHLLGGASILSSGQSLSSGLEEALRAAETMASIGARRGLCPYDSLGLFDLLAPLKASRAEGIAAQGPLNRLLAYDKEHNTAYVKTLRAYLADQGNLCACAQKLYIHRHTLNNRLEKIDSLCSIRLNDSFTRLHLSLELLIYDLFSL